VLFIDEQRRGMIQANELRIGYWIIHRGTYKKVNKTVIYTFDNFKSDYFKPIPLTEEILLKCGTKQNDSILLILDCDWLYFKLVWNGEGYELHIAQGNFYGSDIVIDCTYLHTLQNIVHSLTNEELNIEL